QLPSPPTPTLFPYTTLFRSFHRAWHLSAKPFDDRFARPHHRFRLVPEESRRPDVLFQLAWCGIRERLRIRIFLIKRFSDLVHAQDRKSTRLNSSHQIISYAV